mgnify:CR=1 FL=1
MSGHTPLRLNVGAETRVMADDMPLFDIKCGGMSGRTVADGERIAADIVARYNALEGLDPAAVADVVAALEAMTDLAHGYAEHIAAVPSSELERHPYLPGVEGEINSARTALARIRGEG